MSKVGAPEVSVKLFGGTFLSDGSGHYPGIELINLVTCCPDGILPAGDGPIRVRRVAHDFGRQLIANRLLNGRASKVLLDDRAETVVRNLLKCVELETPNVVKAKSWERTHFFPYTRSLIHWDARPSRSGESAPPQLERRYLRGAGAYAYSVLRHDQNEARLEAIRLGFANLYPENHSSALEHLALTLKNAGHSDPEGSTVTDTKEAESELREDEWENLYRDGMFNILSHTNLPTAQRVRAVMNWTSLWLVLMQGVRVIETRNLKRMIVITDCSGEHKQLRSAAQRNLKEIIGQIEKAARTEGEKLGSLPKKGISDIRGFFGNTAAACGLINAWKGRRHFTLQLSALEALTMAAISSGQEQPYENFLTDWLYRRCRIVVGRLAATEEGMLSEFDGTIFEENERRLAEKMQACGLLTVFSDATRMVALGGRHL
jgi:hypothetical protein